ncbi:hypothetical protein BU15DRAFT_51917 [Melanogaster broomeanus]|nr:hypothetical protein BU15DRAFT_51917 [Melanogaster broomeanus]
MSFTALSLRDALGLPTLASINLASFVLYVLPAVLSYLGVAVLAIKPRTQFLRIALWPLVALLALRAVLSFDFSLGNPHGISMLLIAMYTLEWTLATESLKRRIRPAKSTPSVIMDALDLALNIRGYGWDYSERLHVPRETRPLTRTRFVGCAILSAGCHAFIWGILHKAFQSFSPNTFGSLHGGTIYDETLPFFIRYLRSTIITLIFRYSVYGNLQMIYNLCIIPAVLVLRQDPAQWPPAFDSPWMATSLNNFWARRWHQFFRRTFLFLGGDPLSLVFGSWGRILGGFLASGVWHWIMILPFNAGVELWRMVVPFGMIGVGTVGERMFLKWTGRRVEGLTGWVWGTIWLNLWSSLAIDATARAGTLGNSSIIEGVTPLRDLVERLVMVFETWLHTF